MTTDEYLPATAPHFDGEKFCTNYFLQFKVAARENGWLPGVFQTLSSSFIDRAGDKVGPDSIGARFPYTVEGDLSRHSSPCPTGILMYLWGL